MSLKYRDSQGNETPVAGLNGTSGELVPSVSLYQSGTDTTGTISAGGYANKEITFTTPMPDTDYVINFDSNLVGGILFTVMSKTVSSFVVNIYNVNDQELAVRFTWTAFKLMTDTVHEADAAHIAQNTANFAPAFSTTTSYAVGDYVTYGGVLYKCTTAHTAGVWVAGHFTQVTVGGTLNDIVPSDASSSNKLVTESDVYILSKQYNGATYTTVEALLTQVAADMLAKGGYGGAVGSVWTGKSYFSGTYGTNGSTAGNARLHFENAQNGYTECSFSFTSSGLGTVNWFNDVTTSTITSGSTAPITSGAVAAVKEMAEDARTDSSVARGEIGDITALETTTQDDLVSAINELVHRINAL